MAETIAIAMVPIILILNHPKSEHQNILILEGYEFECLVFMPTQYSVSNLHYRIFSDVWSDWLE